MSVNYNLIAENILKYQSKANLTQKKLAEFIGIKPNSLSAIVGARATASFDVLLKIADKLDISIDCLLAGNLKHIQPDSLKGANKKLIEDLSTATVRQKEILIEILDKYKKHTQGADK